jgi:hypothetical protein
MRLGLATMLLAVFVGGCHGAGPYGHAPNYVPLSEERSAVAGAREYDPVMVQRSPEQWRKTRVALFGVVTNRGTGPGGGAYLTLSLRTVESRNLCTNHNDDDSCRVTVSDRDFGPVHALLALQPDDDVGEHSLGAGSLVRLVGVFGEDVDPVDGAPIIRATYYRHWPRYFYVTNASAGAMRQ